MDLDPHLRGIDPNHWPALKWLPLVLVLLGFGFAIGALLGSASTGLAIGAALTGLFIAWREVLSARKQEELDDRRAEERRQRRDQMPSDPSELTLYERIGRARADRGVLSSEQWAEQQGTQRSDAKRLGTDDN